MRPSLVVSMLCIGCADPDAVPRSSDLKVANDCRSPAMDSSLYAIDVLFVVDDSSSMREEQQLLTARVSGMLERLVAPPDEDGDGAPDSIPVQSLHVGVISTDMGSGGIPVATCDRSANGDDGILQNLPDPARDGCDATYPRFLSYDALDPDRDLVTDFACIASLGTDGCGYEQTLSALEKALTVHARPGGANEGFLREEALLVVVVVSDEDDCSVVDPAIFGDDDGSLGTENVRCVRNPDLLVPVDRLADSILSVKPGRPDLVVVTALVGVPGDLTQIDFEAVDAQTAADFERILGDPRMQETIEATPDGDERIVPSCEVAGVGVANPPRRIVEWVQAIDLVNDGGLVQSICDPSWETATRAIERHIRSKFDRGPCLSESLHDVHGGSISAGEHLPCVMTETIFAGSCGPGRVEVGREDGRVVCHVCQVGHDIDGCSGWQGWYYDPDDFECPRAGMVRFTPGAESPDGAMLWFSCGTDCPVR